MKKITIAVDGHSSTGKSTIAKRLAAALGYIYVDTGAMYRAITLLALDKGLMDANGEIDRPALIALLPTTKLEFVPNAATGLSEMYLNGENVEKQIRTMRVSTQVSRVSAIGEVREMLVAMQQGMDKGQGLVMDGRDIGTVVFPHAELKLFMTASPETRAARRYKEL